ncbi:MAG: tautomerase family protein [Actinomycetota bacterium]
MPLYRTLVRPGLIDRDQRQAFANDVVEVHCAVTGAPPSFVHVVYADDDGQLADGQNAMVLGTIRHGRDAEQKAEITSRLSAALADYTGIDVATITASLVDIDASYTMEGGVLLPEPGSPEEAEWKALGATS